MKLLPLVLLALAGCGTFGDLDGENGRPSPHPFGGVRLDVHYIRGGDCHHPGVFYVLDVPFSLALDLVLLPVSIPVALFSKAPDVEEIPK